MFIDHNIPVMTIFDLQQETDHRIRSHTPDEILSSLEKEFRYSCGTLRERKMGNDKQAELLKYDKYVNLKLFLNTRISHSFRIR